MLLNCRLRPCVLLTSSDQTAIRFVFLDPASPRWNNMNNITVAQIRRHFLLFFSRTYAFSTLSGEPQGGRGWVILLGKRGDNKVPFACCIMEQTQHSWRYQQCQCVPRNSGDSVSASELSRTVWNRLLPQRSIRRTGQLGTTGAVFSALPALSVFADIHLLGDRYSYGCVALASVMAEPLRDACRSRVGTGT